MWTSAPQWWDRKCEGRNEKWDFGKGKCELTAIVRIFGMGKCNLIANFSATMMTSLPSISLSLSLSLYLSLSLSLSLSHRAYLTHNIGSTSALPIISRWLQMWCSDCFYLTNEIEHLVQGTFNDTHFSVWSHHGMSFSRRCLSVSKDSAYQPAKQQKLEKAINQYCEYSKRQKCIGIQYHERPVCAMAAKKSPMFMFPSEEVNMQVIGGKFSFRKSDKTEGRTRPGFEAETKS